MAPIPAVRPVRSTKRQAASTLGPIEPGSNSTRERRRPWLAGWARPSTAASVTTRLHIGQQQQRVGANLLGEECRRKILVDDGLDATDGAVGARHHRNSATPRANHQGSGTNQEPDRA